MVKHTITIPDWLELLLSLPILICRKFRHGYTFRLIPVTRGKYALVSPKDYPWLVKYSWCLSRRAGKQYAQRGEKQNGRNKSYYMHRMIMNPPDGFVVDHIDGDGLNNCRPNLRIVTVSQNNRNRAPNKKAASRYKGVTTVRSKTSPWRAHIRKSDKVLVLGSFKSEIEAAKAYDKAAIKYHGRFARLNFPQKKYSFKQTIKKLRTLCPSVKTTE